MTARIVFFIILLYFIFYYSIMSHYMLHISHLPLHSASLWQSLNDKYSWFSIILPYQILAAKTPKFKQFLKSSMYVSICLFTGLRTYSQTAALWQYCLLMESRWRWKELQWQCRREGVPLMLGLTHSFSLTGTYIRTYVGDTSLVWCMHQ